jgi:hypothetical protein
MRLRVFETEATSARAASVERGDGPRGVDTRRLGADARPSVSNISSRNPLVGAEHLVFELLERRVTCPLPAIVCLRM